MSEQYIGEIRMFAGNFPPSGWAFCDGRLLAISQFDVLFSLIGTTYGGDGQNTFALPDLRGRIPLHAGTNPSTGSSYILGQLGGTEAVTLTSRQLPAHSHIVQASNALSESADPAGNVWGLSPNLNPYVNGAPSGSMNASAISAVGGNLPHDNMMPYLPVSFIIALEGVYPPHS
ncbi:phage tail protein [Paenibacillus aurantiacus]|uniref:Phage tail protein n=1 Tax=Paenibacillus aurantiacus TaxID=1936118 RepID=A0ABV5KXG3_9BACL